MSPLDDQPKTDVVYRRPPSMVRFESGEHVLIGDNTQLHFDTGPVRANKIKLYIGQGDSGSTDHDPKYYTFGQVLALGGDFYGIPEKPISDASDPVAGFDAAYKTLVNGSRSETDAILKIMQVELNALAKALREGKPPSSVYEELGDTLSYQWNQATGGGYGILPEGRYLQLAEWNWDHFGYCAITAYKAGHTSAMRLAASIRSSSRTPQQKDWALQKAYAMDAFACHFLTDLFSAGHMRTPRKQLNDCVTGQAIAGLLARCMHDEDSKYGLKVHNARGDSWTAYGDKRLLNNEDHANLDMVDRAVQASVDEIWKAYTTGQVAQAWDALTYAPDLARLRDVSTRENASPLFVVANGTVECRNSLGDRSDYSWTSVWVGATTLAELKLLGFLTGD